MRASAYARRIGIITDGLEADHGGNLVAARFAAAGVNVAAHLRALKVGRLFIHKCDEAQSRRCRSSSEPSREGEQRRDSAAVVVCAGTTENRIVVRADEHDLA